MNGEAIVCPLTPAQLTLKRVVDVAVAAPLLLASAPLMALGWLVARTTTGDSGFFRQERIGKQGTPFQVIKIRTMRGVGGTTVTAAGDLRITRAGAWMRRLKVDELPQLLNVLRGEMSLVGPRPDVPGFADQLSGGDRILLTVRPGITSPAAVAFRHEEELLAAARDPDAYNRDVLWPEKVRINRHYVENWSLRADLRCLRDTVGSIFSRHGSGAR